MYYIGSNWNIKIGFLKKNLSIKSGISTRLWWGLFRQATIQVFEANLKRTLEMMCFEKLEGRSGRADSGWPKVVHLNIEIRYLLKMKNEYNNLIFVLSFNQPTVLLKVGLSLGKHYKRVHKKRRYEKRSKKETS